jgi:tetratricopeptide (TPR) repeat protein
VQQQLEAAEAQDWFAAVFHLNHLLELYPDSRNVPARRARVLSQAVREWNPKDTAALAASARASLAIDDEKEYRAACTALLALADSMKEPATAERLARACTLAPNAIEDLQPVLLWAEQQVIGNKNYLSLSILGGLLYRAGRDEDAIRHLQEALAVRGDLPTVREELLLAMAFQRLGREEAARRWLNRASAWLDQYQQGVRAGSVMGAGTAGLLPGLVSACLPQPPDPRARSLGWEAWLELQVLHRQARALPPGETKQDGQ